MYQRKELQVGKRKSVLQTPDFGDSAARVISRCGVKTVTERGKVQKKGALSLLIVSSVCASSKYRAAFAIGNLPVFSTGHISGTILN